ncbi:MAG: hypothetical protein GW772_08020 [Flavobacteriia bacterium]|nr:hypothetical protein [Flavobacteriia bacterium]OIP48357.1 MAG: hypothetical protein AUK46_01835 [Flavobacteriaceae bacterium CG2_30_31_66]PIV96302.1 MAG: hypothetical protein COW43_09240 [Flavobacteriaceae bacterium CG17_big_fil_post_rev_8_21_14_2_50_31_13]PIY13564.1 MAG: hypothetical protein COZ16_13795 [Flavobacteriaceae bacterium CG_4_10_14_3_um_filter_31_253]PIZ09441.1 MAG: hypothetical protein COY55_12870 [Flavobacteriaceae bacterium CG_4_10_14_0_8_um_filter_31_99]PJC09959.1 MAG: hypot
MIITKRKKYTLISSDEDSFSDFFSSFLVKKNDFEKEHLVVLISDNIIANEKDFISFLDFSEKKKENGTSFVIVNSTINIDDFPDNFNIVPTIIEAEDILEMEEIERELEF